MFTAFQKTENIKIGHIRYVTLMINRKEGNGQETIHLPNTGKMEKKNALKAIASQSKHYKQKAKRAIYFLEKNCQMAIQNTGHTCKDIQ